MNPLYTEPAAARDRQALRDRLYGAIIDMRLGIDDVLALTAYPPQEEDPEWMEKVRGAYPFCEQPEYDWRALNLEVYGDLLIWLEERKEGKE